MGLEQLTDQMTGLQMADVIHSNFEKVLDADSAENKAENAGLSIKTDYDATRYIDLQLADGTPVKMKMDTFCQAIAPVVAGMMDYNVNEIFKERDYNIYQSMDNYVKNGTYAFNRDEYNDSSFPNTQNKYGVLAVFAGRNGLWIMQVAQFLSSASMFSRIRSDKGNWSEWKQII